MERHPVAINNQQIKTIRQNYALVVGIKLDNCEFINRNLIALLLNVIIIVLLLSGKSWGG